MRRIGFENLKIRLVSSGFLNGRVVADCGCGASNSLSTLQKMMPEKIFRTTKIGRSQFSTENWLRTNYRGAVEIVANEALGKATGVEFRVNELLATRKPQVAGRRRAKGGQKHAAQSELAFNSSGEAVAENIGGKSAIGDFNS